MQAPHFMEHLDAVLQEATQRRAAATAWTHRNLLGAMELASRPEGAAPARFNFLSLPAWLCVAERSGVAFIPARDLPTLASAEYFATMDRDEEAAARTPAWVERVVHALGDDEMLRFEQCAPGDIKGNLSAGKSMGQGLFIDYEGKAAFDIWGERFYDTLRDLGADVIRPYARPIVTPAKARACWEGRDGDWPVEFRVFVQGGTVTGVSAYYPQAPLDPDLWLNSARHTAEMAEVLVSWMHRMRLGVGNGALCADTGPESCEQRADWIPSAWGPQDFTLDFMVLESGKVVFLEGGPGGFRQAAPCCFETGPYGPELMCGIKLALDGPVFPL